MSRNWTGDQIIRRPKDIALALPLGEVQTGELRQYTIELPYLPPSKNQWAVMGVFDRAATKRRWIQRIVRECEAQDMPKNLPRIGLAAALTFPSRRPRDIQNYAVTLWDIVPDALEAKQHGTIKHTRNGEEWREPLFGYGMIPDDSAGRIEIPANQGIVFKYDERTELPAAKRRRTLIYIGVRVP